MNQEKLNEINRANLQIKTLKHVLNDLKHYNSTSDSYKNSSEYKHKWWVKAGRLFSSCFIVVEKKDIIVEPVDVYGTIRFSTELGNTPEMKLEIANSRARILDLMTKETEYLLKIAEENYQKSCE